MVFPTALALKRKVVVALVKVPAVAVRLPPTEMVAEGKSTVDPPLTMKSSANVTPLGAVSVNVLPPVKRTLKRFEVDACSTAGTVLRISRSQVL